MNLQGLNNFLGNTVKFIDGFRCCIDFYEVETRKGSFDFEDEEHDNSFGTTLVLLGLIIFSIFITGITVAFNIIMFAYSNFIAPYISDVVYFTTRILAFITSIILAYYILVKFNTVNSFIDKEYVDLFIKSFQKLVRWGNWHE